MIIKYFTAHMAHYGPDEKDVGHRQGTSSPCQVMLLYLSGEAAGVPGRGSPGGCPRQCRGGLRGWGTAISPRATACPALRRGQKREVQTSGSFCSLRLTRVPRRPPTGLLGPLLNAETSFISFSQVLDSTATFQDIPID